MKKFSIAIHGGAGTILREDMTPELEEAYRQGLSEALQAGYAVLEIGGTAIHAVKAAVVTLEDNPLFNGLSQEHMSLTISGPYNMFLPST